MITPHSVAIMDAAAVESPLDVLSRAATMVQENQQMISPLVVQDDAKRHDHLSHHLPNSSQQKQLPTAKWKRDRRIRPEYMASRKSDPKIPEIFEEEALRNGFGGGAISKLEDAPCSNGGGGGTEGGDAPLDMSVRQRGQPPSYLQTITNPSYKSSYRASVITPTPARDDVPTGISMCDPIIDEHFRRSLGKDYSKIFSNNNLQQQQQQQQTKEAAPAPPPPVIKTSVPKLAKSNSSNMIELMDCAGLSVDDHFAKALGETWLKLNGGKKDTDGAANPATPNQSTDSSNKEAVMSA